MGRSGWFHAREVQVPLSLREKNKNNMTEEASTIFSDLKFLHFKSKKTKHRYKSPFSTQKIAAIWQGTL